jgi:hypothetical protein
VSAEIIRGVFVSLLPRRACEYEVLSVMGCEGGHWGESRGYVLRVAGNGGLVVGLPHACCSSLYTAQPL